MHDRCSSAQLQRSAASTLALCCPAGSLAHLGMEDAVLARLLSRCSSAYQTAPPQLRSGAAAVHSKFRPWRVRRRAKKWRLENHPTRA